MVAVAVVCWLPCVPERLADAHSRSEHRLPSAPQEPGGDRHSAPPPSTSSWDVPANRTVGVRSPSYRIQASICTAPPTGSLHGTNTGATTDYDASRSRSRHHSCTIASPRSTGLRGRETPQTWSRAPHTGSTGGTGNTGCTPESDGGRGRAHQHQPQLGRTVLDRREDDQRVPGGRIGECRR